MATPTSQSLSSRVMDKLKRISLSGLAIQNPGQPGAGAPEGARGLVDNILRQAAKHASSIPLFLPLTHVATALTPPAPLQLPPATPLAV